MLLRFSTTHVVTFSTPPCLVGWRRSRSQQIATSSSSHNIASQEVSGDKFLMHLSLTLIHSWIGAHTCSRVMTAGLELPTSRVQSRVRKQRLHHDSQVHIWWIDPKRVKKHSKRPLKQETLQPLAFKHLPMKPFLKHEYVRPL